VYFTEVDTLAISGGTMIKGFINYKDGKIPYTINEFRMELFTDDSLLSDFCHEHNRKEDYILKGQCFRDGYHGVDATFFVEYSIGATCYLRCYIVYTIGANGEYDTIGFQSLFLDDIFRYKYEYLRLVKEGYNLAVKPEVLYTIPFSMNKSRYELTYQIGHNSRLGLLKNFEKKGEVLIKTQTDEIRECNDLATVLYRLAMFVTSYAKAPFRRISLYKGDRYTGTFFCPFISEEAVSCQDFRFFEFDTNKYIPRTLSNIALNSGNRITQSVPLGHLGDVDSQFTPQRFIQQVMAFEYLYEKLEPAKAKNTKKHPLKSQLSEMFDRYPETLFQNSTSTEVSEAIKKTRVDITHGYAYYYDFKNDRNMMRRILMLDSLILKMSLQLMGFSKEEIDSFCRD